MHYYSNNMHAIMSYNLTNPSISPTTSFGDNLNLSLSPSAATIVCSATKGSNSNTRPPLIRGFVFEPFKEVKKELNLVPSTPQQSLARQIFHNQSEACINQQIKWVFFNLFSPFLVFKFEQLPTKTLHANFKHVLKKMKHNYKCFNKKVMRLKSNHTWSKKGNILLSPSH